MAVGKKKRRVFILIAFAVFIYVNNSSHVIDHPKGTPQIVAHRGLHQEFDRTNLGRNDCTASRIYKPRHSFLENTLPSIRASFEAGADGVEIDIHPTSDGKFAVFHDWRLECRTDGQGVTRRQTMAYLQTLDVGYGYTSDGGTTYPLRGMAVGAMPELRQILQEFPNHTLIINFKGRDPKEADQLFEYLGAYQIPLSSRLVFYGADTILDRLKRLAPEAQTFSRSNVKECLLTYVALGWIGYIPKACKNQTIAVPLNLGPYLWGWPQKFFSRMNNANSTILIFGPLTADAQPRGLNSREEAKAIPQSFGGIVWVESIDAIVGELKGGPAKRGPAKSSHKAS